MSLEEYQGMDSDTKLTCLLVKMDTVEKAVKELGSLETRVVRLETALWIVGCISVAMIPVVMWLIDKVGL